MSQVILGRLGQLVILDVVETTLFNREVVLDQRGNYVHTRFTLQIQAIFSRTLNAYPGPRGGVPIIGAFVPAGAVSAVALQHYLAQPRRPMTYKIGDVVVFQTGPNGDTANGPQPTETPSVVAVHGNPTLHVRCGWVVYVNENNRANPTPLISLSYRQEETLDQDCFSTILTTGRALFRGDRLRALNATPDQFREWLVLPCATQCRRDRVHVTATEDGNSIEFAILDKEVFNRVVHSRLSRVEGVHTVAAVNPSVETRAVATTDWVLGTASAILTGPFGPNINSGGSGGGTRTTAQTAGLRANLAGGISGSTYSWISGMMPQIEHRVLVRCWGYNYTNHDELSRFAQRILSSRIGAVRRAGVNAHNAAYTQTRDLMGAFVEVNATFTSGVWTGFADGSISGFFNPALNQYFPDTVNGGGIADLLNANRGAGQTNQLRFGRGVSLGNLAAQAIAAQDVAPPTTEYNPLGAALTP